MTDYTPAPEVEEIADKLIDDHHPHLEDKRDDISYVFRDKAARSKGKIVLGKARKISGLNAYLAESGNTPFFVVEIARDEWAELTEAQREALVDHELCHLDVDEDEETGEPILSIRGHDLEEFRAVVERHGLWQPDVKAFAGVAAQQMGLFDPKTGEVLDAAEAEGGDGV